MCIRDRRTQVDALTRAAHAKMFDQMPSYANFKMKTPEELEALRRAIVAEVEKIIAVPDDDPACDTESLFRMCAEFLGVSVAIVRELFAFIEARDGIHVKGRLVTSTRGDVVFGSLRAAKPVKMHGIFVCKCTESDQRSRFRVHRQGVRAQPL